jgi:hypothetical protein
MATKRKPVHIVAKRWETWNRRAGFTVYHCSLWIVLPDGLQPIVGHYSDCFCSGFQVIWQAMASVPQHFPKGMFARNEHNSSPVYGSADALRNAGLCIVSEV